jgi:hypothetical protein
VLPKLDFQYPNVNFNDRNSVLATAKALEDTGVAAYNGAGKYISNADYLVIAGKIVCRSQTCFCYQESHQSRIC